ncbi:LysM peptidoglycan-binding domain-containing protein [Robiginitalea sp. IMCC43444]|uniref:LysM peptidoglycan-binding domain-containing protein n=1 Tax=Robiginitalea sp. IMCC43444 TaxID=3459121 RepID=UPI0040425B74
MNFAYRYVILLFTVLLIGCKASSQQFRTHAVKKGETISSIARKYQISPAKILEYNKELRADAPLRPNTILVIPGGTRVEEAASTISKPTDSTDLNKPTAFRSHRVRRRETLFSITRRYEITEDELKRYNPALYSESLQKGMVLRIPVYPEGRDAETAQETELITYTVKPKETRWSIAHANGISIDSLLKLNPELSESSSYLAIGQELKLPKPAGSDVEQKETELYISYTVPPKKTLFSLSQEFKISREEIIRLNPEIIERGNLQQGMVLRLPERKADSTEINTENFVFYEVKPKQTEYSLTRKLGLGYRELLDLNPDLAMGLKAGMVLKIPRDKAASLEVKNALVLDAFDLRDSINVMNTPKLMILFPFRLDRLRLEDEAGTQKRIEQNNALKYSLGLYSGLLVAMDSIADMGVSVDVKTYDTELNAEKVNSLIMREDLGSLSAIIGPLEPGAISQVAARTASLGVPVIAPVPVDSDLPLENIFYTYTTEKLLRERMLEYMEEAVTDQHIMIISDQKNRDAEGRILESFPDADLIPLKEEEKNISLDMEDFRSRLVEEKDNWVFVETDNFKILSSVTSILNSSNADTTRIRMFTTNKNRAFDSDVISATHLSNLEFTYPSVYREAPNSAFISRYRRRFGGDPDRYAVRGFDLGMDLLLRLAYKMNLFDVADQIGETRYTGNKFNYIKDPQSGYYNTSFYILKYENLQIREISEQ